jgi:hypothetical protein
MKNHDAGLRIKAPSLFASVAVKLGSIGWAGRLDVDPEFLKEESIEPGAEGDVCFRCGRRRLFPLRNATSIPLMVFCSPGDLARIVVSVPDGSGDDPGLFMLAVCRR